MMQDVFYLQPLDCVLTRWIEPKYKNTSDSPYAMKVSTSLVGKAAVSARLPENRKLRTIVADVD